MITSCNNKGVRLLVLATLLAISFAGGCRRDVITAGISGELSNFENNKLILKELDTKGTVPVDSIVIGKNGKFAFSVKTREAGFWLLQASTGKVLAMVINPEDQIEVSGDATSFPDRLMVKGTPEAVALNDFYYQTWKEEKQVDSIEEIIATHQEDTDYYQVAVKMDTLLKTIWERQRVREIGYITRNASYLSSLLVLNYAFGMNAVLDPTEDQKYYQLLDSSLMKTYPGNKHVIYHHERMISRGNLKRPE